MDNYLQAMQVMNYLFQKDYQFALATTKNNQPSVRFVDTYYLDGAFYIVTHRESRKIQEILHNPKVALTNRLFQFSGKGEVIGHPKEEKNQAIRKILMDVFEPWYLAHNNEENPNMCFLKIHLEEGFYYHDGTGYKVHFMQKSVESFPYDIDIEPVS